MSKSNQKRKGVRDGEFVDLGPDEIDYVLDNNDSLAGPTLNLAPLQNAVSSQRLFYASRFFSQADPLEDPDEPWVQNQAADGQSFDEKMGRKAGAIESPFDGVIREVTANRIKGENVEGEPFEVPLYDHFSLNRKNQFHQSALVKPGDRVNKGQVLTKSNFTNDRGTLALGRNARVGVVPYLGYSMDDATVISESFANRLKSDHLMDFETDDSHEDVRREKNHFRSVFPQLFTTDQLDKLADNGVVKPGTELQKGDPITIGSLPPRVREEDRQKGAFGKYLRNRRRDISETWKYDEPGVVRDVVQRKDGSYAVSVETKRPAKLSDKLVTRSGSKFTISKIVPDEEMPRTKDGEPFEILANPLGLPSRQNVSFLMELLLGKVAAKRGEPMKFPSFNDPEKRWTETVRELLDEEGLSDTEDVWDPVAQRYLENPITTGNMHVLKLMHQSEGKMSARGTGGYTQWEQPRKGGDEMGQCFTANQVVNTVYGPLRIGQLVRKKMRVPVKTYDFDKEQWTEKPVSNWFVRRAKVDELVRLKFCTNAYRGSLSSFKIFNHASMDVTKNHDLFTPEGEKVKAGLLKPGDHISTWGPVPTKDQWAFLVGSLLGDGYIHVDNRDGSADDVTFQHGETQRNYVQFKQRILSSLLARITSHKGQNVTKNSAAKCVVNSVTCSISYPWIAEKLREMFYDSEGTKRVTRAVLDQFNELSLVALFLDDGYINYSPTKPNYGITFSMMSFTREENEMLAARMKEVSGIDFHVNDIGIYKGGHIVCWQKAACEKLARIAAKYVSLEDIPKSKHSFKKLFARESEKVQPVQLDIHAKQGLIPIRIKSVEPYRPDHPGVDEINVYDITVDDTHNYLVSNTLVSNSGRLSGLELSGLLSAGAYNYIKDGSTVRGQKNDEYWRALRSGQTPAKPGQPFAWDRTKALLHGSGYMLRDQGQGTTRLGPITDRDTERFKAEEIQNADMIDYKTGKPIPGGLFDESRAITNRWGKISLDFPLPNPAFETPLLKLLGLKKKDMENIIAGEQELEGYGTGSEALYKKLKDIDPQTLKEEMIGVVKSGVKTKRPRAIDVLNTLSGLERNKIAPHELMVTQVPVIPSRFRPFSFQGDTFLPGDVNELYGDMFRLRNQNRDLFKTLGEGAAGEHRMDVYDGMRALYGTKGTRNRKLSEKGIDGFLKQVLGVSPKYSVFQRNLFSKTVDGSGRGVAGLDPTLGIDEVGIPRKMAWKLYAPYVQRRLVKSGMSPADALRAVDAQGAQAESALREELASRPGVLNRSPAWHKFNSTGAYFKLHDGPNVQINPLIAAGQNADFDGDDHINSVFMRVPRRS